MKLSRSFLVAAQLLSALALPAPNKAGDVARARTTTTAASASTATAAETVSTTTAAETASTTTALSTTATAEVATTTAAAAASTTTAEAAATTSATPEAGEGEENEVEQQAQFGQVIELGGGNIKTDTLFPAGTNGVFEVEFQNQEGRQLRVTENKSPAAAPAGFVALEPVSYIVELGGGAAAAQGLTLQRIDYIRNANSTIDISPGRVARFCPEAGSFVFGEGELEFEAEENELTLTVANMVGEWAFFVPQTAAGTGEAGAGEGVGAGEGAGEGAGTGAETGSGTGAGAAETCGQGSMCRALLDALQRLTGGGAAATPAAR